MLDTEIRKQYYINNRERIIKRQKEYNQKNKDIIKEKRLNNPLSKEKKCEHMKRYYNNLKENNPEKYKVCKDKARERAKKYRMIKRQEKIDRGEIQTRKSPNLSLSEEEKKERQKEYKKKYIESIKQDPEKYKMHKEKVKNRVRKCYEKKKSLELE